MKVRIDKELCSGHGRCSAYAKDVYELDDNGYSLRRGETFTVPVELEEQALIGADNCPEGAITIIED